MSLAIEMFLSILAVYLGFGLIFAILFVFLGVKRIDHAAAGGKLGFKLMIIPGCMIFWPFLFIRWITGAQPPEERSRHRQSSE
tara:strand:- start:1219 stop:1467 length:249 start_codon:yes stop_codon:yes gene_type:complete